MKSRSKGFTLLELLLVLVVTAVLAALATPSFRGLWVKRAVQAAADALVTDLRYARSEAIKRAVQVSVCQSGNGTACAPGAVWAEGWIVFVDRNEKGFVDPGDEVLRVQSRPPGLQSIASNNPQNDHTSFTYEPTGLAKVATQTFILTPAGSAPANSQRLICVSSQGRARIAPAGSLACS